MKLLFRTMLICLALVSGLTDLQCQAADLTRGATQVPVRDKWALIVGISKFKNGELDLKYPAKDAKDVANFLLTDGNFARDHVKVLTDSQATRERILDELGDKWLPRVAAPGDLVVIYLSTHGSPADMDVGGVNYLVAYDTDKERLYSTGIAMQDLCNIVKARVHSDRTLIIMDACHSGATTTSGGKGLVRPSNVDAEAISQGTGQMVICSSSPSQRSWESKTAANSVFTKRLIEGLKVKGADTTVADTFQFLSKKVEEDVLRERGEVQSPILKSKWEGDDLKIAVAPIDPRPGIPFVEDSPSSSSRPQTSTAPPASRVTQPRLDAAPVRRPGKLAEDALRAHFSRMAYASPGEAYADFTPSIQNVTPFARYQVNVRKQKYVPSVANMPAEAFKFVSATANTAIILVNEKWITGQNVLWRYSLVRQNGVYLIDGFKIITAKEWSSI